MSGTVQGVGFRPFVHRTATRLGLDGWVRNADGQVVVTAAGTPEALDAFVEQVRRAAPPLARVGRVRVTGLTGPAPPPGSGFAIRDSTPRGDGANAARDRSAGPAAGPAGARPGLADEPADGERRGGTGEGGDRHGHGDRGHGRDADAGAGTGAGAPVREVPPDAATCPACLRELFDPADRRHRYPFVNCTDCGPRATVIEDLPYDRERTTMRGFPLCARCAAEYADPADRRFHAEPLACPECGPRLAWRATGGPVSASGEEALRRAVGAIADGGIVAVKALGGYQLVCDAGNSAAVDRLRRRKHRPAKPLAVMVRDLAAARRLAVVGPAEQAVLTSPAAPVVLCRARAARPAPSGTGAPAPTPAAATPTAPDDTATAPNDTATTPDHAPTTPDRIPAAPGHTATATAPDRTPATPERVPAVRPGPRAARAGGDASAPASVAAGVHPGTHRIGLFLPTSGLHHLLLYDLARPLVVTSGNLAGEPIATGDDEAVRLLSAVADGFLFHDRPIRARYDDSVVLVARDRPLTVRRARGCAPAPLPLPVPARIPLAAAGAQLKHTFALAAGDRAVLGPHTGDLQDARAQEAFAASYADLTRLTGITPRAVAHDLHPGYLSTQWARALLPHALVPVQHHHAHIAAVAAEHGLTEPVTGVAYDGLGLGDDGTLWGGEILVAGLTGCRRVGRWGTAPLPGGEAAVRHPARMALGYLHGAEPLGAPPPPPALARALTGRLDPRHTAVVRAMIARGLNSPRASSVGRLFDAVAALLGLGDTVSYEGQAAVALEAAAGTVRAEPPDWRVVRADADGLWVADPVPVLTGLLERLAAGVPVPELAAAFHTAVAEATAALVGRAVAEGAPRTVCLAGGCFQNHRLLTEITALLHDRGLRVLTGSAVPVGDGGISYGQAAVAAALLGT
ncbi:carbamoyltransferase HypF [Streptomyces sp. F63]|nr:carbamoyltransferase HypF [Streptomyces sp. F63]